jgi:hypothetical protein
MLPQDEKGIGAILIWRKRLIVYKISMTRV